MNIYLLIIVKATMQTQQSIQEKENSKKEVVVVEDDDDSVKYIKDSPHSTTIPSTKKYVEKKYVENIDYYYVTKETSRHSKEDFKEIMYNRDHRPNRDP